MCGIAGFLHPEGHRREEAAATLREMTRTLVHRGPDGEGFFLDAHAGLGHTRLAIVDRDGGAQPMANETGTVHVVFNGEIYNDPELRPVLEGRGHRFRTGSDTEVIVHAWEEWGPACVEHLDGMFAFALWDGSRRCLFLARDRFGKKPLHYAALADGGIAFASELKALDRHPGIDHGTDLEALSDYLSLGYVPREKTIFRGVRKLLPAHTLLVEAGRRTLRSYWDLSFAQATARGDDGERLRAELERAVRIRLRSDVPIGAFLSGGLDSSTVVALMTGAGCSGLPTTALGFAEAEWDERHFARAVAQRFGTSHRDEAVGADALQRIDTLARAFDEPFADASALPTYLLSGIARERATVVLSGDGGDETFGGYRRYAFDMRENRIRNLVPGGWGRSLFALAGSLYPESEALAPWLRGKAFLGNVGRTPWDAYFHSVSVLASAEKEALLAADVRAALAGYRSETLFEDLYHRADGRDSLSRVQYIDFKTYLPDEILTKVDRASMAHALEVRCPLLDRRVVEFAASLPASRRIRGGRTKIVLREAMAGLVPPAVLARTKMGFAVPLRSWLRADAEALVAERLLPDRRLDTFLVPGRVRGLWEEHRSGRHDRSRVLWSLLMLSAWLDQRERTAVRVAG